MASTNCREVKPVLACYTPTAAGPRAVLSANHIYGANGKLVGLYYTDAGGALFDVTAGTVALGACPIYQPDVEWEKLCDKLATGEVIEYMCRTVTSFDTSGNVVTPSVVATFEMDKVTPYTPVEPVDCIECCDDAIVGVITDLSLLDDCLV